MPLRNVIILIGCQLISATGAIIMVTLGGIIGMVWMLRALSGKAPKEIKTMGHVWDEDGTLVASFAQESLIRSIPEQQRG